MKKYQHALSKMETAFNTIRNFEAELQRLTPILEECKRAVERCQADVENGQRCFSESRESCKQQEKAIEALMGPLESLRKEAKRSLDEVGPC